MFFRSRIGSTRFGSLLEKNGLSQFVKLADTATTFSSNLPVVVLDKPRGGPVCDRRRPSSAWFYLFSSAGRGFTNLATPPSLATPATMSVRGNFSSNFPKQRFSLTLQNDLGRDVSRSLVGA